MHSIPGGLISLEKSHRYLQKFVILFLTMIKVLIAYKLCGTRFQFGNDNLCALCVCTTLLNIAINMVSGCTSSYELDRYPDMEHINTQVAEQSNSLLARLKGMLSYMTEDNFVRHLKMFLAYRNIPRRLNYTEPVSSSEKIILKHSKVCRR